MLLVFALISELTYLFLSVRAREAGLLNLHDDQHMFWVVSSLTILFLVYFWTYFFLKWQGVGIKVIFAVVLLFNCTLLLTPFLSSNDLYSYIFTTRVNGIFGENPYFVQYDSFQQDPLYLKLETIWAHHPTLYGPLFLHIGGFLNWVGQSNLLFLTAVFKFVFVGANILSAFLIFKISKSKRAVFLFATNPLVVYELAGNSHTESITILFFLASVYFLYRRPIVGFASFVFSVLIKYYSALFLPLFLIKLKKEGRRMLSFSLVAGILLTVFIYFPFWRGPENFDYLFSYYNGQYISPSLAIYLGELLLGSYKLSFQTNTVVFLVVAGVLLYKFWKSKAGLGQFVFCSFLLYWMYVLTKSSLILPWYLILLVLLGSICSAWKEYRKYALAGVIFVSVYSLGLYYFVRV